nr:synaptobrevin, longin-like domain protein [Tanacetum cinerariifolium]
MSPKSSSWNQFPSSIATTLICLSTGKTYNFSRFILEGMIGNVKATKHKFLMYPRFLQMILAFETADRTPRPTSTFTRKLFANMKFRWAQDPVPLTPPMMAITAGGNAAGDAPAGAAAGGDAPTGVAAGGDAADEANVVANDTAGGATEVPQAPQSPPVSPVREPTLERQPTPERPLSLPPSSPETEWVVLDPVSPVADWRPWPYVHVHFSEPESPPFPPKQTFLYEEPIEFGPVPRPTGCMGRIATLEKDLGTSKQVIGGAILKLVNRVKRLEKQAHLRRCKLVIVDSNEEAEVAAEVAAANEDDIDLDENTTLATAALGSEQPAVPTENVKPMEEQEEMEVPLTRKRSTYGRVRTQFYTPAFVRFRSTISTGVLSPTVVPEPVASYVALDTAGPSIPADKGKDLMP